MLYSLCEMPFNCNEQHAQNLNSKQGKFKWPVLEVEKAFSVNPPVDPSQSSDQWRSKRSASYCQGPPLTGYKDCNGHRTYAVLLWHIVYK